jgi:DNA-binding PadR family transcriptional regulator
MYELFILGLLTRRPAHGYLIAKIINDMIGPYARISHGRLYPLLSRLEQDGLIVVCAPPATGLQRDRQLRNYEITEAGKQRFHALMMDTSLNPGEYRKVFGQKSVFLDVLRPDERLYVVDHYINYCQTHVLHLTAEADDMARNVHNWGLSSASEHSTAVLRVIQHGIDQWQLELTWAQGIREQELARARAASEQHTPQNA